MEGGFASVHSEMKRLGQGMSSEFERLDQSVGGLDKRVDGIDKRIGGIDRKLELGDGISGIEKRLATLEARR